MKKEMIKPAIIVLLLVSAFAMAFIAMNSLAFAGARGAVVQVSDGIEEDAIEVARQITEENKEDLEGMYDEAEKIAIEEMLRAQDADDRAILSSLGVSDEEMDEVLAEVQRIRTYDNGNGIMILSADENDTIALVIFVRQGAILVPEEDSFGTIPAVGFELPPQYSSIEEYIENMPVYEIRVNVDILCDLFGSGSDSILADVPFLTEEMNFTMIDHTRWNKVTNTMSHVDDFTLQPHHLSFEQAAALAAVAIYGEYGESVDGLEGFMVFTGHGNASPTPDGYWIGFILDSTRTEHNMGDELFQFMINAVTGEIIYVTMTTPDNPWLG